MVALQQQGAGRHFGVVPGVAGRRLEFHVLVDHSAIEDGCHQAGVGSLFARRVEAGAEGRVERLPFPGGAGGIDARRNALVDVVVAASARRGGRRRRSRRPSACPCRSCRKAEFRTNRGTSHQSWTASGSRTRRESRGRRISAWSVDREPPFGSVTRMLPSFVCSNVRRFASAASRVTIRATAQPRGASFHTSCAGLAQSIGPCPPRRRQQGSPARGTRRRSGDGTWSITCRQGRKRNGSGPLHCEGRTR